MVAYHKTILITAVVSAFCLICFGTSSAMPEYAKRYKLSCTFCHLKVPLLNEFGASFLKDNPTPPEMKLPPTTGGNTSSKSGQEMPGNKDGGKSAKTPGDSVYDNTSSNRSAAQVEPPAPTIVYRLLDKDGNRVFTDNPIRKTLLLEPQKPGGRKIKPVAARKNSRPAKLAKVQPPVSVYKPDPSARSGVSAVLYRSYEECMEKILLTLVEPANADEAMGYFLEAEETCRQFTSARR